MSINEELIVAVKQALDITEDTDIRKKLLEYGYDDWLLDQADEYNDPHVYEVTIKGTTNFDVIIKNEKGEEQELKNIPLEVFQVITFDEEDYPRMPRYSEIEDKIELDFDSDSFEFYTDENTSVPNGWEIVKVKGFSEGHSLEDLTIE